MVTSDDFHRRITNLSSSTQEFLQMLDTRFKVSQPELFDRNFPQEHFPLWMRPGDPEGGNKIPSWIDSFFRHGDRELQKLWVEHGYLREDPAWLHDLLEVESARVSRVIALTGNINDYAFDPEEGYMPVIDRIEKSAARRKDWVIRYSLSSRFNRTLSMKAQAASDTKGGDPLQEAEICAENKPSLMENLREDFQGMERILRRQYDGGVCLIIENLHMMLPPESRDIERNLIADSILRWAQAPWMYQSKNVVILLAESLDALSGELRTQGSQIEVIEIKRPDTQNERLKFLTAVFSGSQVAPMLKVRLDHATRPRFEESEFGAGIARQLTRFADRTSGLNLVGLENLLLHVNVLERRVLTQGFIRDQKREILIQESAGLLTVTEPEGSEESRARAFEQIGGLERITERLLQISHMMDAKGESEMVRRAIPKGLLFLGPPGTGKTLVARAFAIACGVNFAELGDIREMWVGQSERNLSRVLSLIRSLRPVIVFVDEIDQSEGSRGEQGDTGVGKRIFSKLLQFMADPELEGEVLWIGASNRPDLIDPALKRAGRFDLVIPFFLPEADARKQVFNIQFRRRGAQIGLSDEDWKEVQKWSEGYTGAEIEALVKEAIWRKLAGKTASADMKMSLEDLKAAFSIYCPPANRDEYERMILEAVRDVTFIDLLPERYRKIREEMQTGHKAAGNIATFNSARR